MIKKFISAIVPVVFAETGGTGSSAKNPRSGGDKGSSAANPRATSRTLSQTQKRVKG